MQGLRSKEASKVSPLRGTERAPAVSPIGDLGRLSGLFLILWLDHPGSLTGDTRLRSGLVVLLSPIQNIHP